MGRESKEIETVKDTRLIVKGISFVGITKVSHAGNIDLVVMGSYGGRSDCVGKIFCGRTAEKGRSYGGLSGINRPASGIRFSARGVALTSRGRGL